jgi:DNA-binding transcriptional LysR family regulator
MKSEMTELPPNQNRQSTIQIRMVDLNLFRVFDAMMLHRSVRKASQMLSVTPSAISHALNRLRQTIDDELFIPGESGMEPTRRALELSAAVREGLESFELALTTKPFVPMQAIRTFRIAASDHTSVVILPSLVNRLVRNAPQVDLRVFPLNRLDVVRALESGQIDLVIGWFAELPGRIRRTTLYRESEAVVVRAGHPLTQGKVTKERLFEFSHVVVELTGTEEHQADGFMHDKGVARRVWIERALLEFQDQESDLIGRAAVCVPHFATVPPLLQATDMVATLPRRLALWTTKHFPLVLLDLPYTPKTVDIEIVSDQRADRDQGLQWLIAELGASIIDLEKDFSDFQNR